MDCRFFVHSVGASDTCANVLDISLALASGILFPSNSVARIRFHVRVRAIRYRQLLS